MALKFVNREEELRAFETWWEEKGAQLIIVYGKRRVGKTELIKQFMKGKPAVYYLADRVTDYAQLKALSQKIGESFGDYALSASGFDDWYKLFAYLSQRKERLILAIDEFPYLAEANRAISSIFQKGWDEYLKNSRMMLILSGSSIGMMEKELLAYRAPLYGRRSGQIFLKPMRFFTARKFFPGKTFEEFLEIYTIAGGIPAYLLEIDAHVSLETNLRQKIFNPKQYLYQEGEFILYEELREPRTYLTILKAIAFGKRKFGEIANESGLAKNVLMKYLHILEDLCLVEKEVPVTEKNPLLSKKGLYRIQDQFLNFWFKYVFPFKSQLELGDQARSFSEMKKTFRNELSRTYELAAREIIQRYPRLPKFTKVGRFWERDLEIDLVALNEETKEIMFGEAKWSDKLVGIDIFQALKAKAERVPWGKGKRKEYFCLFSKSGFTPEMMKIAKKEKVFLFQKDNLL